MPAPFTAQNDPSQRTLQSFFMPHPSLAAMQMQTWNSYLGMQAASMQAAGMHAGMQAGMQAAGMQAGEQ